MMTKKRFSKKKAISPILATVILIAITLVAAVAISGFVFGLFGTFTSSANLQGSTVSCFHTGGGIGTAQYCVFNLTNTGGSNAGVTGCFIYGTAAYVGAADGIVASTPQTIPAGTTSPGIPVYCVATAAQGAGAAGEVVSGSLVVSAGAPIGFTGTYS
ncbi:MAG: archaellin/type IV pilin N-terminal domain-containing protein [Nitrososphaerales archaeon]